MQQPRHRRQRLLLTELRFEEALTIDAWPRTHHIAALRFRFDSLSEKLFFRGRKRRLSASAGTILESRQPRSVVTPHALLNGAASQTDFRRDLRFGAAQPRLPDNPNSLGQLRRLFFTKQSLQILYGMVFFNGHSRTSCQDDGFQILASVRRKSCAVRRTRLFLAIRIIQASVWRLMLPEKMLSPTFSEVCR